MQVCISVFGVMPRQAKHIGCHHATARPTWVDGAAREGNQHHMHEEDGKADLQREKRAAVGPALQALRVGGGEHGHHEEDGACAARRRR
jgi:hypothetical protein